MSRLRRFVHKFILLLLLLAAHSTNGAFPYKCPVHQLHFQKVLGFRPQFHSLSATHLLHHATDSTAINQICLAKCRDDIECSSYVLFFNTSECYGFTLHEKSTRYETLRPTDDDLVADAMAVYFEKICLNVPSECNDSKSWPITRIPGSSLVHQGKKTLTTLVTRSECAEKCLYETEFKCLSASFIVSYRNNYVRQAFKDRASVLGSCILSAKDKTIQPDSFRVAPTDEEYIENQCAERATEHDHCAYELYGNSALMYAEVEIRGGSHKDCQHNCSLEKRFFCQGATFIDERQGHAATRCLLHSEDIISLGPRSLRNHPNAVYMRRVKCLDIQVRCTKTEMQIQFTPYDWFQGRMYVNQHSDACGVQGNYSSPTLLRLPIGNEVQESRCGILRAYQLSDASVNRTLISTLVVIQMNPLVQTQGDRLVKTGCILNGINGEYEISFPENDNITVGSSLAFHQSAVPGDGSVTINTGENSVPNVHMQIVDLDEHHETNEADIGQNLEMRISAPNSGVYDFKAVNLKATSQSGHSSIFLIDSRGCPTDITVFPAFVSKIDDNKRVLTARFHAFKFAESTVVNFDVMIQFCLRKCPAVDCQVQSTNATVKQIPVVISREKRNAPDDYNIYQYNVVASGNPRETAESYDVPANVFHQRILSDVQDDTTEDRPNLNQSKVLQKMLPLQFQLVVRGHDTKAENESFIIGENSQILVAGIAELPADSFICLDPVLLIILLTLWLLLQIVLMCSCCFLIRKYKKLAEMDDDRSSLTKFHDSLDFDRMSAEARRVRWADQGSQCVFYP